MKEKQTIIITIFYSLSSKWMEDFKVSFFKT